MKYRFFFLIDSQFNIVSEHDYCDDVNWREVVRLWDGETAHDGVWVAVEVEE